MNEVICRPVGEADANYFVKNWAPDKLEGYRLPCSVREMRRMIQAWNAGTKQEDLFQMYLVLLEKVPAGLLSLQKYENVLSVGVSVVLPMRRKGCAISAVEFAKERAREMGCEALTAQNRTENGASIGLCRKCGFECEGTRVNAKGNLVYDWKFPL